MDDSITNNNQSFERDLIQRLTRIEQKVDEYKSMINDHERRIRFLEKGIWLAVGAITIIDILVQTVLK